MILLAPFREEQYPETTTTRCIKIYVPDDDSFLALLASLISLLGNELNYTQIDDVLASKHAQIWRDAYLQTDWLECDPVVTIPIGTVLHRASATLPEHWLYANGDVQLKSAYPLLFDVLGDTWGDVAALYPELEDPELYFLLPDARDTFLTGYMQGGGSPTFASEGGSKTHTLTSAEIPAHSHKMLASASGSSTTHLTFGASAGNDTPTGNFGTFDNVGGGSAHNNMPPYVAMNAIIYAGE
jgi:microcystin-dependent protein